MILITGATGFFGKATVDFLLQKGIPAYNITILVRDITKADYLKEKGVKIKIGNYDDYSSLLSAFEGIEKLLLISGNDIHKRLKQHENVVNAASEAGVNHIIYTSFIRKNETDNSPIALVGKSHIETDRIIKASGMEYTIMLNGLYSDILPMFFGEQVLENGIYLPTGEGKAAFTTRNDMAEAAANILIESDHENKEYIIANNINYSMYDAATILSEITGKKIEFINPTEEDFINTLTKAGVPTEYVSLFASFSKAIKEGEFETLTTDLGKLINRQPTSLNEYLKSVYIVK